MNRAEKRRQQRLARNSQRSAPATGQPTGHAPDIGQALDLAMGHHAAGRLPEAGGLYRRILQADPKQPAALHLLGVIAHQVGKNDVAVELIGKAIAIKPDYAEAYSNLGLTLQDQGKLDEGIANYHKAIAIKPDHVEAHNNLGNALQQMGKLDEAAASYHRAIAIKPDYAEAYNNLGGVLHEQGRPSEAIASYRKALAIKPDYPVAHNNLGNALQAMGELAEAVASYHQALARKPDYADAHGNLGLALQAMGKLDEAVGSYHQALALKPDSDKAHSNLLLALNYSPEVTQAAILEESRNWNRRHGAALAAAADHANDRSPDRRLRIGYVSPDMCGHSVGYFFEPLLAAHAPDAVETFCYAGVAAPDATTRRLRTLAGHWRRTVGVSDAALAETIRADGIDILVDLAGHTAGNRLLVFARRPAPVQATWLGYANTTGLEAMDYRIVDAITDPDDTGSETLVRLANGFLCYRPPDAAPAVAAPRPAGPPVFGSFNNITKLSAPCMDLWSRLLAELPEARLLLKSRQFADASTRQAYHDQFAARGVAPERLDLRGRLESVGSHLGLYGEVDVCLDAFPYNGTTTTCEALWMGVPVVTLRGGHHRGRVGASLLTRIGLDDCIAADAEAYIAIAAGLAGDTARRAEMRTGLRGRMAPLCDAGRFARDMEAAYRAMWHGWCAAGPRQR